MSDASSQPKKSPIAELAVFDKGFTKVPAFWVDDLMNISDGIPASFWKFLLFIWRDIVGQEGIKHGYQTEKTQRQFPMDKDTANQWTVALQCSGCFHVELGYRKVPNQPGVPTKFKYANVDIAAWRCFIVALRDQILEDRRMNWSGKRDGVDGFRMSLAVRVDAERERAGLRRLFDNWIKRQIAAGKIKQDEEGKLTWDRKRTDHFNFRTFDEKYEADPYRYDKDSTLRNEPY
jgi:hypothetical protein